MLDLGKNVIAENKELSVSDTVNEYSDKTHPRHIADELINNLVKEQLTNSDETSRFVGITLTMLDR